MSSKNRYGFLQKENHEIPICQLCKNLEDEDKVIILHLYLDFRKIPQHSNEGIQKTLVSNDLFKKIIRKTFKLKYKNINELCLHQVIQDFTDSLEEDMKTIVSHNPSQELIQKVQNNTVEATSIDSFSKAFKQLKLQARALCSDLFLINDQLQDYKNSIQENQDILEQTPKSLVDIDNSYAQGNQTKNKQQKQAVKILQKWFLSNLEYPYLDFVEKKILQQKTGMKPNQIHIWVQNARERYLTPLLQKEEKEEQNVQKKNLKDKKQKILQVQQDKVLMQGDKKIKSVNSEEVEAIQNQLIQNKDKNNLQQLVKTEDNNQQIPLQIQKYDFIPNHLNNSTNYPIMNGQPTLNQQTLFQPVGFYNPSIIPYYMNQTQYFYPPYPYFPYPKFSFLPPDNTQWRM